MTRQVKIGVFLPAEVQVLDLACIDLFHMMSREYLDLIPFIPKHVTDTAPSVVIYYISCGGKEMVTLTSNMTIKISHDITHPDVQPGKLDILLVPGPDPTAPRDKTAVEFLRHHANSEGTDILSVCTGIYLCGDAGLLEGRKASGPRGLQSDLKKKYPGVTLVGDNYRWTQDGNYWSSGGVTNGNDLVMAYTRAGKHFPSPVVEIVGKVADVGERAHEYGQGQTTFMLGFAWQLLKAWFGIGSKAE